MKLFRLRFILLGLLLCLCHVWCLNCQKEFVDPASSAFFADVVLIVKLSQKLPPLDLRYNATVIIENKRSILKGVHFLRPLLSRRGSSLVTVGEFGLEDPKNCVANLEKGSDYMIFLKRTNENDFFRTSAMPVSSRDRKEFKRAKKDVKKILCKKEPCCMYNVSIFTSCTFLRHTCVYYVYTISWLSWCLQSIKYLLVYTGSLLITHDICEVTHHLALQA